MRALGLRSEAVEVGAAIGPGGKVRGTDRAGAWPQVQEGRGASSQGLSQGRVLGAWACCCWHSRGVPPAVSDRHTCHPCSGLPS